VLAPRWLALHGLLVVVLVAFGLLGWWQFETWRDRPRDDARATASVETARPFSDVHPAKARLDPAAAGTLVTVSGRYDLSAQVLLPQRVDGRNGYGVITPLRTGDDAVVVVHRGWVADQTALAAATPASSAEVTVTGTLERNRADTGRRGGAREIATLSTAELLRTLPYPPTSVYDGHVALVMQRPAVAGAPEPVPPATSQGPRVLDRWRNLAYALQWWLFGAAAVFLWGSLVRQAATVSRFDDA